jgi:hypothetical protein
MSDRRTFILVNDRVRANALDEVRRAPDGFVVTVSERTRSTDQNAMFHAICSDIAKSGFKFAGKPRAADVWKVLLISGHAAATGDGNEVLPGLEGEFVNIRESSARMGVRRAASLITYCLAFCDTNGIALTETRRGGFMDERAA